MLKRLFQTVLLLVTVLFAACQQNRGVNSTEEVEKPPVYVSIHSHNEWTWGPIVGTRQRYVQYRANLVERLHLIKAYGAKFNWQSDYTVLEAMIAQEDDSLMALTSGKNILEYMDDLGFSIDPHCHLIDYNYADIAHLMRQLNVTPSGVIGGVRIWKCGSAYLDFLDFIDWHDEIGLQADGLIHGAVFPQATWRPTILAGAAMGGHWFDESSSGVWRPGRGSGFREHQAASDIVFVGQGYSHDQCNLGATQASGAKIFANEGSYVLELAEMIAQGEVPADQIYTASIHVRDCETVTDNGNHVNVNAGLRTLLNRLQPLVDEGRVVYTTYQDVVDIWQEQYSGRPCRLDLSAFSIYAQIRHQAMQYCE